jgi:glycerol-3-phosphate dehydrogenase
MRRDLDALASRSFDLLVIGAGIHGAWIAMRAACAGWQVALIERDDFGAATSANSLKILHGGLRYLQHLDWPRMRSSIAARRAFMREFPHLVQPLQCVLPLQSGGIRSGPVMLAALVANDLASIDRNRGVAERARLPAGKLLSREATRALLEPLATLAARGGASWWDGLANDTSRLTLEPVLRAAAGGASVANQVAASAYLLEDGKVCGVVAHDRRDDRQLTIRARVTINATGPWIAQLSRNASLPQSAFPARWVGAMNLVLRRRIGPEVAVALTSRSKSADPSALLRRARRELFFVPWRGVTMIGTDYHPGAEQGDAGAPPPGAAARFLEEAAAVAPNAQLTLADVAAVHWGLLPADATDPQVPGKRALLVADAAALGAHNLIAVVGEKFTSAPALSLEVLRAIATRLGDPPRPAVRTPAATAALPDDAGLTERVAHAIREEQAFDLQAVLRRVGAADSGAPGDAQLQAVTSCAAAQLGWNEVEQASQLRDAQQYFQRRAPR